MGEKEEDTKSNKVLYPNSDVRIACLKTACFIDDTYINSGRCSDGQVKLHALQCSLHIHSTNTF